MFSRYYTHSRIRYTYQLPRVTHRKEGFKTRLFLILIYSQTDLEFLDLLLRHSYKCQHEYTNTSTQIQIHNWCVEIIDILSCISYLSNIKYLLDHTRLLHRILCE